MISFTRDASDHPKPSTWDYVTHKQGALRSDGKPFPTVALCTCPNGHTCGLSREVHSIENDSGRLSPSYVCPVAGCGFHDLVGLTGWSWAWFNLNCAPDRP